MYLFVLICDISEFGCDDGSSASLPVTVTVIVFTNSSTSVPDDLAQSEPGQFLCVFALY